MPSAFRRKFGIYKSPSASPSASFTDDEIGTESEMGTESEKGPGSEMGTGSGMSSRTDLKSNTQIEADDEADSVFIGIVNERALLRVSCNLTRNLNRILALRTVELRTCSRRSHLMCM